MTLTMTLLTFGVLFAATLMVLSSITIDHARAHARTAKLVPSTALQLTSQLRAADARSRALQYSATDFDASSERRAAIALHRGQLGRRSAMRC